MTRPIPPKTADVVVFGTGLFAECVHFLLTHDSPYRVVAFTVHGDRLEGQPKEKFGVPVVPFEQCVKQYPPDKYQMFVAVGYTGLNRIRAKIYGEAKALGYKLITYISSKCTYWGSEIGDNCFIFEDNTIQPFVKIGNDVVLWSGNHIGHHGTIGDHVFISSHVVVSGQVEIGPYCFLGVNATLRDGIRLGESCLIGAGALIMKSVQDRGLVIAKRTELDPRRSDELKF